MKARADWFWEGGGQVTADDSLAQARWEADVFSLTSGDDP